MRAKSGFQESQKPYAVIIGLDSLNGIQAARILARHKIPIIAIAKDPNHYGCKTRVCERIIYADTATEDFIKTLETIGPKFNHKAVLIPCTDMNVLHVSRSRQELEKWYHISLPDPEVVETLMNKISFYKLAQQCGFPIPGTRFIRIEADIKLASEELKFPCVVKPPMSAIPEWEQNSKLKAYKVTSAEELLEIHKRFKVWADELIVQEWVEGPDSNLYSCNCYFNAHSEPIVTFVARKLRQWPPVTGESSLGEECRDDAVLNETIRLFRSIHLRGMGYLEIKKDVRSGEYFIIEPNIGRPTGRSSIAEAGGVELLYTVYCDQVGLPLPADLQQKYTGVKWISLRRDLQSAYHHWRKGDLSLKEWWCSVRGPKAFALFSWTDPGPFIWDLIRGFRLYLSAEERRKRNFRDL